MGLENTVPLLVVLAHMGSAGAVPPIPENRRIEATIIRTLTAPTDQPMHMPTDVAVDGAGRVYVADGANDRIVRFDPQGNMDRVIAEAGKQRLNRPVGLAVDPKDRLWIAETGRHRLLVVTTDGELIETISLPRGEREADPTDLTVTPDGRRTYIVDNDNHRLVIRNNGDGHLTELSRFGRGLGQLQWPFMICLGPDGDAFVTEAVGARVQRLSASDQWVGQIGQWGVELGHLYRPKGIAADNTGLLYVGDSTLGVVQVFEPRGPVRGVLTGADGRPLHFDHPMGMCFDRSGRLYVVELRGNRVAVVTIHADSPPPTPDADKGAVR